MRERRKAIDYAHILKELADTHLPDAEKITLVHPSLRMQTFACRAMDNLNTHCPASLYQAFPPTEARRLTERFEWHYTPKHGSWLNIAECEPSVLARQCLDRRIPDRPTVETEIRAWAKHRNSASTKVNWRFSTDDARIKLKHLYPQIS